MLVIAGMDPSGGAGIVADVQALTALGVHPAPVTAAVTVQDTRNASAVRVLDADFVAAQARAVLADMPVAAIKLGLLGNAAVGRAVAGLIADHAYIPVVLDPVLVAAGGAALAAADLAAVLTGELLPRATLATPNGAECRSLAPGAASLEAGGRELIARGCRYVLVTGGDEATGAVTNILVGRDGFKRIFEWPRLPGRFHGSGCTLAAAAAAAIARGQSIPDAAATAQRFTHGALENALRLGRGQRIPRRSC